MKFWGKLVVLGRPDARLSIAVLQVKKLNTFLLVVINLKNKNLKWNRVVFSPACKCCIRSEETSCSRSRPDVQTCTSWKAPIIWEGMFLPERYDQMHKDSGSSVALTVFAIGRLVFTPTPEHTLAAAFSVSHAEAQPPDHLISIEPPGENMWSLHKPVCLDKPGRVVASGLTLSCSSCSN